MLTDEQAQELQAANAAMMAVAEKSKLALTGTYMIHPSGRVTCSECRQSVDKHASTCSTGEALAAIKSALADPTAHTRLALERATVQALRERVKMISEVQACDCPRCERDRGILAQWEALGVEA